MNFYGGFRKEAPFLYWFVEDLVITIFTNKAIDFQ
jgi:hypothetical protein